MSDGPAPKSPTKRQPIRKFAERWGVSVRTVKRWGKSGVIDPPERINGRDYLPEDAEPRRDSQRHELEIT